jgi:hypothetical protein
VNQQRILHQEMSFESNDAPHRTCKPYGVNPPTVSQTPSEETIPSRDKMAQQLVLEARDRYRIIPESSVGTGFLIATVTIVVEGTKVTIKKPRRAMMDEFANDDGKLIVLIEFIVAHLEERQNTLLKWKEHLKTTPKQQPSETART